MRAQAKTDLAHPRLHSRPGNRDRGKLSRDGPPKLISSFPAEFSVNSENGTPFSRRDCFAYDL
jgi:hypothetical protein